MDALFYTPGEVAAKEVMNVSVKTVYRMLVKGEIPGAFKFGGTWRIDREIFHAYYKRQATPKSKGRTDSTESRHDL